ncbi:MAG: cytochrome c biogenesis protein ResB [Bacteroidales bacterium]
MIILIAGFMLEYFSNSSSLAMPSFPLNLIIVVLFTGYLIFTYFIFKNTAVITVLTGIPMTIAAISAYTFLSLIMGFIAQEPHPIETINKLGLTHIKASYPFMLSSILLLMILGYTIIKRMTQKMTIRNLAFFLNHAGLFIIILAGSAGTGDMLRISVPVEEGDISSIGVDEHNQKYKLPFQMKLNDFQIEEYPPEMILYNRKSGEAISPEDGKLPRIHANKTGKLRHLEFHVEQYYEKAVFKDSLFIESDTFGSVHAAKVKVFHNNDTVEGWISTDNFMHKASFLYFDNNYVVGALQPKVQKYRSDITIYENGTPTVKNVRIEVNKPYRYAGWAIYQHSYDARLGRWSPSSIFQVSKDPWLPVVYTGIFMMLLGALYLIYSGRQVPPRQL